MIVPDVPKHERSSEKKPEKGVNNRLHQAIRDSDHRDIQA